MKKLLIVGSLLMLVITGCKNDLDIIAPYKETMVVYGLLNADTLNPTQYVKIYKAFLGESNAYTMAQNPDSFNYPDILDVQLQRLENGQVTDQYLLERDESLPMDSGAFANYPNINYRTPAGKTVEPLCIPQPPPNQKCTVEYQITITNRNSGAVTTAKTVIIPKLSISSPNGFSTINFANPAFPYIVKFTPKAEHHVENLTIVIKFDEVTTTQPVVITPKELRWVFPNITSLGSTNEQEISIDGETFYQFLQNNLQVTSAVYRDFKGLDFVFTAGAEDLYTYTLVNQPPLGIVQEIPDFTNITGGKGIFSSRFTQVTPNMQLTTASYDSLRFGQYTYLLGFQ